MKKMIGLFLMVAATVAAVSWLELADDSAVAAQKQAAKQEVDPAAVERSRKTVGLLDNIFKQTVVLVTDK